MRPMVPAIPGQDQCQATLILIPLLTRIMRTAPIMVAVIGVAMGIRMWAWAFTAAGGVAGASTVVVSVGVFTEVASTAVFTGKLAFA